MIGSDRGTKDFEIVRYVGHRLAGVHEALLAFGFNIYPMRLVEVLKDWRPLCVLVERSQNKGIEGYARFND
jgi:fructose-1,6-bisphosphatase